MPRAVDRAACGDVSVDRVAVITFRAVHEIASVEAGSAVMVGGDEPALL